MTEPNLLNSHTISLGFGHRGFFNHWAKIEVGSKDEATQAIERLGGIELEGREIKVAAFKEGQGGMQGGQGGKNGDTEMKDGLSNSQKRRAHKKAKVQQVIADLKAKLAAQVA